MRLRSIHLLVVALLASTFAFPARAQTITWWHWYPPEVWSAYEPLIEEFEQETGIDVLAQYFGWSTMKDKLVIGIAGGIHPDVVTVSSRWADGLASQGVFVDVDRWIGETADAIESAYFPVALDMWRTRDGVLYALPLDLDVPALFYNKEIFNERGAAPPTDIDWESWFDVTRRLTLDRDGDGDLDQYGLTTWWYPWITLVWANGALIVSEDLTGPVLSDPAAREAIEYYKRLHNEGPIPDANDARLLGAADPSGLWKEGRIGMAPAGAWMPRYHLTAGSAASPGEGDMDSFVFDFGIADMPSGPTGIRATPAEGSGIAVMRGSERIEAASQFARYAASDEFMARVARHLEGFPARIAPARQVLAASSWGAHKFMDVVGYARPFPKGVQWWESLHPIIMRELGRYIEGTVGLQGAIENIDRQVQALTDR